LKGYETRTISWRELQVSRSAQAVAQALLLVLEHGWNLSRWFLSGRDDTNESATGIVPILEHGLDGHGTSTCRPRPACISPIAGTRPDDFDRDDNATSGGAKGILPVLEHGQDGHGTD
jgi:hypothetical protein